MAQPLTDPNQNAALARGEHGDPFAYLGPHRLSQRTWVLRVFRPGVESVTMLPEKKGREPVTLGPPDRDGVFAARLRCEPDAYRLCVRKEGSTWEEDDPFRFGPVLGEILAARLFDETPPVDTRLFSLERFSRPGILKPRSLA